MSFSGSRSFQVIAITAVLIFLVLTVHIYSSYLREHDGHDLNAKVRAYNNGLLIAIFSVIHTAI